MSPQAALAAAALAAALLLVAAAMPADYLMPPVLNLSTVLNRTVCPIKVEIDVDLERIPKRIKVMKCANDPNQWCAKNHIPPHECCQHRHDNIKLECVEVQDTVQVYFPKRDVTQGYRVSVGCTCIMQEIFVALPAEPAR